MTRNRYESITIKTVNGELFIRRGYDECRICGYKEIPFDHILGTDELANKITKRCMMEISYYGQNQTSFEAGAVLAQKVLGFEISRETVRQITESIGNRYMKKIHKGQRIQWTSRKNPVT